MYDAPMRTTLGIDDDVVSRRGVAVRLDVVNALRGQDNLDSTGVSPAHPASAQTRMPIAPRNPGGVRLSLSPPAG
jgi:hypothetical protein